ncbi:MAG: DUF1080 domain-containing protein [Akkermansiaceae bacterium]|jgi:hypothetical protein|nr:DUF1080 domain-containing protein [Akkermansiaceae bacterium]
MHHLKTTQLLIVSFLLLAPLPVIAAPPADPTETQSRLESEPGGWRDIMPAADLKGWRRVPVPPGGELGRGQWHVDQSNKVLVCDGDGGHDMLLFDEEIGDAVFHAEFRYTRIEGKSGYNSGIYARNSRDGDIWHQAQIGDGKGGFLFGQTLDSDGQKQRFNQKTAEGRVKPAGEWNTIEITAVGRTLTLWVNGAVTCRFEDCGRAKGYFGLEGEGYRIEFRNLKVKKLD